MVKTKKYSFLCLIALLLMAFGYCRDFVFKSINALLQAWDHDMDYEMPRSLRFFQNFDYNTIVNLKWLLTLLFSGIYLLIAIAAIRLLFSQKAYIRITIAAYSGILFIAALFISMGFLFKNSSEKMYEFARYLMGMAQSPIVLMILIPTFIIFAKEKNSPLKE